MNSVVIGGGAWGTAIANLLALNTPNIKILTRNLRVIDSVNKNHTNAIYFPNFSLDHKISATNNTNILKDAELIFVAVPSQAMRDTLKKVKENIRENSQIVLCNKGIEQGSLLLMSEVTLEELPNSEIFVLSGPNFAHEILIGKPSFSNLAGQNKKTYQKIASVLSTPTFFAKHIVDINGAQVLASFKNVMAIICGLLNRLNVGFNTLAAVMSLSLEEALRFMQVKGGNLKSIMEFCGIGDLILTCSSNKSRNFRYGYELIDGYTNNILVEGRSTLESLHTLAHRHNLDCILIDVLYEIVNLNSYGNTPSAEQIQAMIDLALKKLSRCINNH